MAPRTRRWPDLLRAGRPLIGALAGASGLLLLSHLRGQGLDAQRGAYVDCRGCFVEMALHADLALVAFALLVCTAMPWLGRRAITRIAAFVLLAVLALAVAVDVGTMATLGHRLLLADLLNYGAEGGAIADMALPYLRGWDGLRAAIGLALALAGFGIATLPAPPTGSRAPAVAVATGALLALVAAQRTPPLDYLDSAFFGNVVAIQWLDSGLRHHSTTMARRIRALPEPAAGCASLPPGPAPQAIILVVLESWSLHHSALFSGLDDATPRLDAWARRGRWYPDFVANSYSTEAALIALLNGRVPIPSHRSWGALAFSDVDGDFHRWLAARGWHTRFATTGALHFGERAAVMTQIGIEAVEGSEHPAYTGLPRGPFEAASDRALVDRFLQWFDHERPPGPFMATLLTVGTHPPFVDTDPGDPDAAGEAAALQRMDREVDRLLRALEARGVMETGTVVVLGDHRAMTPIRADEATRFGESSASRVPAFALGVGAGPVGPAAGPYQQTDLLPTLRALVGGKDCRTTWQGRMLGPDPQPAEVVVYAHPRLRNELRVLRDGETHRLRLDGDDTGWVGAAPPGGAAILNEAMRQRLSRDPPDT